MSLPGDKNSRNQKPISGDGGDALADRFNTVLHPTERDKPDKPDTIDFDLLGSPVSPLRAGRRGGVSSTTGFTNTSSSSSSSGSISGRTVSNALVRREEVGNKNHSGELCGSSGSSPTAVNSPGSGGARNSRHGHRRTGSGQLLYSSGSGGSSVSSPMTNVLPTGNICPSGKILPSMAPRSSTDVLGSGTTNYGHGSIVRGSPARHGGDSSPLSNVDLSTLTRRALATSDPEEVRRVGNELYGRGHFAEALRLYDRAIALWPGNPSCRSNRAAALMALGRLGQAVRECEEVLRLDPNNGRAHQRLASLYLRLGQVESSRTHLYYTGEVPDPMELQKLQAIERHLRVCGDARKIGDWKSALRESDAAIAAGADSSAMLFASRAESLLRLHQLEEADSALSHALKLETSAPPSPQMKFSGMLPTTYLRITQVQVDMALGRFENAELAAEKVRGFDSQIREVAHVLSNVKYAGRARARGKELFNSGKFADACMAYTEGLKFDPSNPVLYCNRAVCHSKLEQWQKSVEDCNEALKIHPNYTKALLRRATSYGKLERWSECVRDYEALLKELPNDKDIAEALFHAQVALKTSRGEEVSNMKFGGEVEEIVDLEQFRAAISLPGVSVVYFMAPPNQLCIQISPFVDTLCSRYPSLNFLKVDVEKCPAVATAENVRTVPTFKIYKNGTRVKEMICPSKQVLEYSVRHYSQ